MFTPEPHPIPIIARSTRNPRTILLESPEQTHMRHLQQAVARCEQIAAYHRERKNAGQLRHAELMVKMAREALERAVC